MRKRTIGIFGIGMVGGAIRRYFEKKPNYTLFLYDKFKKIGSIKEVNYAEYIYLCVPTPSTEDGHCDTSIIEDSIAQLDGEKVIVIKSTVPPGTTERLQGQYPQHKLLFSPEFLTEMTADQDMEFPDRQIVGYTDKSYNVASDILMQLPLAPYERIMPATEAEMVKYAANCWFATKVTYANQLYDLCEKIDIDYKTVLEGMATDKRIGRTHLKIFHKGYRGYGGKCLPKDSKALLAFAKDNEISLQLLKSANDYNDDLLKEQGLDPLDTDKSDKVVPDTEKRYSSSKLIRHKVHG